MKNYFALFFVFFIVFTSCKDEENMRTDCNTNNPLEDIEWIKAIDQSCNPEAICNQIISKAVYQEETVYFTSVSGPLCDPVFYVALRNCVGDTVKVYTYENSEKYNEEVTSVERIKFCSF